MRSYGAGPCSGQHRRQRPLRLPRYRRRRDLSAIVNCTPVNQGLPDDDTLVLIALDDTEVWTGWRDGDIWRHLNAVPITAVRVPHWMHMPPAPGGAS